MDTKPNMIPRTLPDLVARKKGQEKEVSVFQRASDGYINATKICQAAGREWDDYNGLKGTKEFLHVSLQKLLQKGSPEISGDGLICSITTGDNALRGTWVHPNVAIHVAQWASPEFAFQVTEWIREFWETGTISPQILPARRKLTLDQPENRGTFFPREFYEAFARLKVVVDGLFIRDYVYGYIDKDLPRELKELQIKFAKNGRTVPMYWFLNDEGRQLVDDCINQMIGLTVRYKNAWVVKTILSNRGKAIKWAPLPSNRK